MNLPTVKEDFDAQLGEISGMRLGVEAMFNDNQSLKDKVMLDFLRVMSPETLRTSLEEAIRANSFVTYFDARRDWTKENNFDNVQFTEKDIKKNSYLRAFVSALEKNPSVVRVDLDFGSWRVGVLDYTYPRIAIHFANPAAPDSAKWRNGGWFSKVLSGLFSKSVLQAPSLPAPARNREIISKLQAAKDKVEETIVQINNLDFDMDPIKLSVKRIEAAVDARYVSYAPISHAIHNMNATADVIKEYIDIERHCGVAEAKVDLPEKSKKDVQRLLHTLTKSLGETADKALEPMMVRAQIGAAVMQETMERRLTRD